MIGIKNIAIGTAIAVGAKIFAAATVTVIVGGIAYELGKTAGYKKGYIDASEIFEKKYRKQAEEFIKRTKVRKDEVDKLLEVMSAQENLIDLLNNANKTLEQKYKKTLYDLEQVRLNSRPIWKKILEALRKFINFRQIRKVQNAGR